MDLKLELECAYCKASLTTRHRTLCDNSTIAVAVELCAACESHGANRRIDTIETCREDLWINGKPYTLSEAREFALRISVAVGLMRSPLHAGEMMAHDSARDQRTEH
jgi:hypothetical protein